MLFLRLLSDIKRGKADKNAYLSVILLYNFRAELFKMFQSAYKGLLQTFLRDDINLLYSICQDAVNSATPCFSILKYK